MSHFPLIYDSSSVFVLCEFRILKSTCQLFGFFDVFPSSDCAYEFGGRTPQRWSALSTLWLRGMHDINSCYSWWCKLGSHAKRCLSGLSTLGKLLFSPLPDTTVITGESLCLTESSPQPRAGGSNFASYREEYQRIWGLRWKPPW